jgi:hypothetical protein
MGSACPRPTASAPDLPACFLQALFERLLAPKRIRTGTGAQPQSDLRCAAQRDQIVVQHDRQQISIVAGVMALVGNVTMNIFLIPALGIVGAAIATAISYSGACVLLMIFYCLDSGISWIDVLIAKPEDIRFYWDMMRRALIRGWRAIRFSARA